MSKPKLFTYTAYRLPNKEDLIDIDNCKLTSDEIIEGFGYTIVGRGILGSKQRKDIIQSIQMLVDMFPTNKEYKKALETVKQKYNLKESKMALPLDNKPTQDPINLSLKELIAADLPAPIQTEAKEDGFIALPSSSCQAYKYDEATETLYIRFTSGVYEYFDVPEEVVQMLVEAKSIGSFFYHNIRKIYNYALSKKYKVKGTKRTVNESQDAMEQNDDEEYYDTLMRELSDLIDEQVYQLYVNYKGDKSKLYPLIDDLEVLFAQSEEDEEAEEVLMIESSPEFEALCDALNENNTLTESTESEIEPDITDEQETFYFTSSTKDILGIKGLEHPKAQGLAVEILAKFRKEFQSALDKSDISQSFIMTLEFKDKEQMPNAELEEELNDENPLD